MISSPTKFSFISPSTNPDLWDSFVRNHASGSVFHLSGMCRAFDEARRFESLALAVQDAEGTIHSMITPIRVDTLSKFTRMFTSRAIMFAEPLCYPTENSVAATQMILQCHASNIDHSALYTEIRPVTGTVRGCPILASQGYVTKNFCNYIVDLRHSEEQLWNNISKQMRGNISRSLRRGIKIEIGNTAELIARAYAQIKRSHRRSLVPTPGIDLFLGVRRYLGDILQVRVATIDGCDVAGTVSLAWGDRFFAWYGGTSRPKSVHPFACIVWDEIKWAQQQGLNFYDFGGAGDPNEHYGPREFKSRFHGDLVQYDRCCKIHSPKLLAIAEYGYKSLKHIAGMN